MNKKLIVSILLLLSFNLVFSQETQTQKKSVRKNSTLGNKSNSNNGIKKNSQKKTKENHSSGKTQSPNDRIKTENKVIHDTINLGTKEKDTYTPKNLDNSKEIGQLQSKIISLQDENQRLEKLLYKNKGVLTLINEFFQKYWYCYLLLFLVSFFLILKIWKKNKNLKKENRNLIHLLEDSKLSIKNLTKTSETKKKPDIQVSDNIVKPIQQSIKKEVIPESFCNIQIDENIKNWLIVGASTTGKSHLKNNTPCQDNHYCDYISKEIGWGIAICSDGAGSALNSQIGSGFVCKELYENIKLKLKSYTEKNILPNDSQWKEIGYDCLKKTSESLKEFALKNNLEYSSLACTAIAIVFTPHALLSLHVGDGRAGYCNSQGEWLSIITPHKGEESNQTIFITSPTWQKEHTFKMSDVLVPETRIVTDKIKAFTILTDGCETHSFDCSKLNQSDQKWHDPNTPSEKFYNKLTEQLSEMHKNKGTQNQINDNWIKFLESGTNGLKEESDDKTMLLGIIV